MLITLVHSIYGLAFADDHRTKAFDDPFGSVTEGFPGCPEPEGPMWTAEEVRKESHWRAERGTNCYRSGRCRLPNSYSYDREIFPRAQRYIQQDQRFLDASIWIAVQRRWIFVYGCMRAETQGLELESALRLVDDVEAVVGQWMVGTTSIPPYQIRKP